MARANPPQFESTRKFNVPLGTTVGDVRTMLDGVPDRARFEIYHYHSNDPRESDERRITATWTDELTVKSEEAKTHG